MNKGITSFEEALIFFTSHVNDGYWHVEMNDADGDKTRFSSNHRLSRFAGRPFRIRNAPNTFQGGLYEIPSSIVCALALVRLDSIIILSQNAEDNKLPVCAVLSHLLGAGTTLNIKKCLLFFERIDYLGQNVRSGKLELAGYTLHEDRHLTHVHNLAELKSFFPLCNVFWWIFPSFACTVVVNKILKKVQPRTLDNRKQKALNALPTLQEKLIRAQGLALIHSKCIVQMLMTSRKGVV